MLTEWIGIAISFLGILVGAFVAYHVYKLSKQKTFGERFQRRESIQRILDDLLYKIRNGYSSKVELINVAKYDKYYPHDNTLSRKGYTYIGSELKGYHFAGVEFFSSIIEGCQLKDEYYRLKKLSPDHEKQNIFVTGTIPYEWIESINISGDDTSAKPQFYVHFDGIDKFPYKKVRYYIKDESRSDGFKEVTFKQ